jgi:hypothetical protein
MRRLFSRRLFFLIGAAAGLAAALRWRRARQERLTLEWEADIADAIDEGRSAAAP